MIKNIFTNIIKSFPLFPVVVFFGLIIGFILVITAVHSQYVKYKKKDKYQPLYITGFTLIGLFGIMFNYISYNFRII